MQTRDVEIVYAWDPDTDGPDLKRIGQVVTLPKADARTLVNSGEARYADIPRDDLGRDLADLPRQVVVRHAREAGVEVTDDMPKTVVLERLRQVQEEAQVEQTREDLTKLTAKELRDRFPAAAELPANAKKADLVAAAEESLRQNTPTATVEGGQPAEAAADGSAPNPGGDGQTTDGTPIVTVMPGAGLNNAPGDGDNAVTDTGAAGDVS